MGRGCSKPLQVTNPATIRAASLGALPLEERMARRRFQDPKPRKEGKWWYLRLWEDVFENGMRVRKLKRIKLALATMGERQVRKIALDIVAPKNKSIITTGAAVNFSEYVDTAYMNTAFKKLSSTTRACYQGMIDKHLKPAFGKSTLSEITPYAVDAYFSAMPSRGVSHPLASKIVDTLSSILRSALVQAHCRQSTRRARGRSRQAREESKALHLPISIRRSGTDHTRAVRNNGLRRGVDTGLRVSELSALRWRNIGHDCVRTRRPAARRQADERLRQKHRSPKPVQGLVRYRCKKLPQKQGSTSRRSILNG